MCNEKHYFASSCINWTSNKSLEVCLKKQRLADTRDKNCKAISCHVWKVPLPEKANYMIDNYTPQVENVKLLTKICS